MRITKLWPQLSLFGDFHSMSVTRNKILERGFKIESNFFFILALQWNISWLSEGFLKKKLFPLFFLAKTYKILRKNGKNNINKTKNSVVLQIFEKKKRLWQARDKSPQVAVMYMFSLEKISCVQNFVPENAAFRTFLH